MSNSDKSMKKDKNPLLAAIDLTLTIARVTIIN